MGIYKVKSYYDTIRKISKESTDEMRGQTQEINMIKLEIKNLEKFVLSQERESYSSVQERIDKIKQKYQACYWRR